MRLSQINNCKDDASQYITSLTDLAKKTGYLPKDYDDSYFQDAKEENDARYYINQMTKKLNDVGINISSIGGKKCDINDKCTILTPKKWNWHEVYANLYGRALSPSEISKFCKDANVKTTKDLVFNSVDPAIKWLSSWKAWI